MPLLSQTSLYAFLDRNCRLIYLPRHNSRLERTARHRKMAEYRYVVCLQQVSEAQDVLTRCSEQQSANVVRVTYGLGPVQRGPLPFLSDLGHGLRGWPWHFAVTLSGSDGRIHQLPKLDNGRPRNLAELVGSPWLRHLYMIALHGCSLLAVSVPGRLPRVLRMTAWASASSS